MIPNVGRIPLSTFAAASCRRCTTFSQIFQECPTTAAASGGEAAHARLITSGHACTLFVANCLIAMYLRRSRLSAARQVFDQMPVRDIVSWNTLIAGYAREGSMEDATALFSLAPGRDPVTWNSLISGFLLAGSPAEALGAFVHARRDGAECCDSTTLSLSLKSCAAMGDELLGTQVHALSILTGLLRDVVVGTALLDMYAKCHRLPSSLQLFHQLPTRNSVSWAAIIAGCVHNNRHRLAVEFLLVALRRGVVVSQSIYASMLRSCAGLCSSQLGRQMHCHALKNNFNSDPVVGTAILDMYAKCGNMENARSVFQSVSLRNLQTWNAMIAGLIRNGQCSEAVELFRGICKLSLGVNDVSVSGAFSACAGSRRYAEGLQVHAVAIRRNLDSRVTVQNAAIGMYGKCQALAESCEIFHAMEFRDAVSWNAMIAALEHNRRYKETLVHLDEMLSYGMKPDDFTFGSSLKACAALGSIDHGIRIHGRCIKFGMAMDPFVGSSLVDMYCKCEAMDEAMKIHERLGDRSTISWNAMISGFSSLRQSEESQLLFSRMIAKGLKPDNFTYSAVLGTCADLATVELGKQIHAQIVKLQLQRDLYISSTLVDMYSKCGNMDESLLIFERMTKRDFVAWNAMISGYAQHGCASDALEFFHRMGMDEVKPNHATFIAVLRACGHIGMFDEGMGYFYSMFLEYGLEPQLEHYSCMVDLLGRSGRVIEALKLIEEMPCEADATMWRTLLSVCQFHKNLEVAEVAAASILQLEPDDSSAYILLSNIYAASEKWEEVSKIRRVLRENKLKKEPGCSWIQVKNEIHVFLVGDKVHSQSCEVYGMLSLLISEMRKHKHQDDTNFIQGNCVKDYNGEHLRLIKR